MTASSLICHEDLAPGATFPLGTRTLSKDEIIAFGRSYDPQPMHIDEEAAKATLVGGLCASGFHTCAVMMRMACDGILNRVASLGSPGVEEVKWKQPVRPDEPYTATYRVLETRDMASRRDVGLSRITVELFNGKGELAASWISVQLTRRRAPLESLPEKQPSAPRPALPDIWSGAAPPADVGIEGFFEDRPVGETVAYPGHTFERDAIIDFARQFDPQPFHLDEAAAKASLFGGLCASGWHTAAIFIRSVVSARMAANAKARAAGVRLPLYGPSPGFRNLRWFKPVFVGDSIEFRARVADKIDLKSRPERGLIVNEVQGRNQKGEIVFAITSQILAERRVPYRPA
ncbi:MAG: MaoC family dehydratase [Hyphomicrobiaceae bacterium]|nr:MaoC family dehydratase [Hyphomicrobiaceae bacterium]